MKRLERALLLMVLAISLLFSSAPTWAQGNEPVHVYILLDAGSMYPEETRFAGTITGFAERIKRQNPRNRVSVVVKNDVMSKDTYGNFFGNYRGFTHRENLIFEKRDYTLKDSMERVKAMQKKDDPSLRKVLLIIDDDGGVDTAAERKYNFRTHYLQYADLVIKTYVDIMRASAPFCRNQEVYTVRFPIGIADAETPATYPYILKSTNLRNQFGKQILDGLQNQGYYEMKEPDPQELDGVLRRYEKKIEANTRTRVPAPYTITERIGSDGSADHTYKVVVDVEKKPGAKNVRNLRFHLALPAGHEIVKDNKEPGFSTESEVKLDNISGEYAEIQWRIRYRGKAPKATDKVILTYTNDDYLPERTEKQLDLRPQTVRENYWSFRNFTYLENYQLSSAYAQDLLKSVPWLRRVPLKWGMKIDAGGNCYGMAFTSILANDNKLDKERWELKDINNLPVKNSDRISKVSKDSAQDIIHLYQSSQLWARPYEIKFRIRNNREGIQKLVRYMRDVEEKGAPPVLFSFSYTEEDSTGEDSKKMGHTIVMYRMTPSDKAGYDHAIEYYDSNSPGTQGYLKLYVNSESGDFTSSDPSLNTGRISSIVPRIDSLDPFKLKEVEEPDSMVFIKPGTVFSLKSLKSNRRWAIDARNMDNTNLQWSVISGGKGDPYYAIVLPEKDAAYRLVSTEDVKPIDLLVSYPDQLIAVKAEGAKAVTFKAEGSLAIEGAKGRVEAEFARDKRKGSEENFYAVKGRANGDIALSQTSSGLKGEGKLSNVQLRYASGKNREETKGIAEFNGGYLLGAKAAGLPFSDVAQSSWYYPAVRYVYEKGLMTGVNADTFSPETTITRAQMAQIIYNMEGGKPAKNPSSFKDVPSSHWSYKAVSWAKENNIVKGYEDGSFKPNAPITRQDAVAILYRYKIKEATANLSRNKYDGFKDRDQVAAYAQEPMAWAVDRGIVNGDNHKRLNPRNHMKRAEMAQILKNGNKIFH